MIRPSFIPPRPIWELRDFTRRRKQMIGLAAEERNRVQKVLEDANVKIGDVLSDVFGLSPRGTPENRPMRDASKPANGIRQDKVVITYNRHRRQ